MGGYTHTDYINNQSSYDNNVLTGSTGPAIQAPTKYSFGKGIISGAAAGACTGNPWGAAIGAGVGLLGDVVGYFVNKRQSDKTNKFNAEQAEAAFAREQMAQHTAAMYNSPSSQVERLKAAGLSPSLALSGGLQPTGMGAASSSAATGSSPTADFNFDGVGAYNAAISARQADSLITLQSSQGAKTDAERIQVEIDNITRHQQNLVGIEQLLARKDLDVATRDRIKLLQDNENKQLTASIENLTASSRNLGANTEYILNAQTPETLSRIGLNNANARSANATAEYTSGALTEKSIEEKNSIYQQGRVYKETANQLALQYGISQNKVDFVADILEEHGFSRTSVGYALDFAQNIAEQTGKSLPDISLKTLASWFSGDNWIPFISQSRNRTSQEKIAKGYQNTMSETASGHDATQLAIAEKYIQSAALSADKQHKQDMNRMRSEWAALNNADKKRVASLIQGLKEQGLSDEDINDRAAYLTHILFESSRKK